MHAAAIWAARALKPVLDFALPPRCPGCGAVTEAPHRFCLACWSALTFLGEPCCARCALPFAYGAGPDALCGACLAAPPAFDRLRAAVAYGDISREVALKLKYGGRPGIAETMARFMARHLDMAEGTIVAPVPLHRWRIWRRGYNQSGLIAAALARRAGLETKLDLIRRVKRTPPLRGMGRRGARRLPRRQGEKGGGEGQDGAADRRRLHQRRHRQCLRRRAPPGRRGADRDPLLGAGGESRRLTKSGPHPHFVR
jgi:predicted amidophosphoribosyltransferase